MIELTTTPARNQTGAFTLQEPDSGWVYGFVGDVTTRLDPMERVVLTGTFPDGTTLSNGTFYVPTSIVRTTALAIMEYITAHYAVKLHPAPQHPAHAASLLPALPA